jgi:endonuclease G
MRTLLLILIAFSAKAQDTVTIRHKAYSTTFDKIKCYPIKVEWWVTKNSLICDNKVKRGDKFLPDPSILKETDLQKDYTNSGFDRGHNFPAADAVCDRVSNEESFYFSNMTAQYPALNRGDWKSLETVVRDVAAKNDSTKVWCGSVGEIKKIGKVSVPKQCWKVVYVKATNEWTAYLFNNDTTKADGVENNKVSVTDIQKLTGFTFK